MKSKFITLLLSLYVLTHVETKAQEITVTGSVVVNDNGRVECFLNYKGMFKDVNNKLFLDSSCHVRYIRNTRSQRDEKLIYDWDSYLMNNSYSYSASNKRGKDKGLPSLFTIHYYFDVPVEDANLEAVELKLRTGWNGKKLVPVIYNSELGKEYDKIGHELFIEKKEQVGLDLGFLEFVPDTQEYLAKAGENAAKKELN